MAKDETVVMVVGDVILNRPDPGSMFSSVGATLRSGDITFGNCETPYAEDGSRNPLARGALIGHPRNVPALRTDAGFDVMSFTNNHHLDFGYEAFLNTLDLLRAEGIAISGAGREIEEARRPAIIEHKGTKVAFLSYTSILPLGYEADKGKPGGTPLRAHTHYLQLEEEQPGTPPKIMTFADREDLAAMVDDVKKARTEADFVIFSCHWGLHYVRATIADYEREVARAAIDAGADIVFGTHAHILKGIDTYRGKLIFHNLGNFAMDVPLLTEGRTTSPRMSALFARYKEDLFYDPAYPRYPYSPDARKTAIIKLTLAGGKIRASLLPCHVSPDNSPILLSSSDPMFVELGAYVRAITSEERLESALERQGNEYLVLPKT